MKVKIIFFVVLLNAHFAFSQILSVGGFAGGGVFNGNSISITGFTTSLFAEINTPLFEEVFPRVGLVFVKDFNAVLPNTSKAYNPYLAGVSVKGITTQYSDSKLFLEEGVGLIAINDRTFIDTNIWDYGVVISLSAGFDLRNFDLKGFKLGAGAEYGITFFNTLPKYSSIHLYLNYTI